MRFDDIGENPIYWCTFCGPQAQKMNEAISKSFSTDPNFAAKFEKAINEAES
jgi:hypothetical protein